MKHTAKANAGKETVTTANGNIVMSKRISSTNPLCFLTTMMTAFENKENKKQIYVQNSSQEAKFFFFNL